MNMDSSSIEQLISEIYKRDPLWNQKANTYHDRFLTKKLWSEIGEIMSCGTDILRTKWKNLRNSFRRELNKVIHPRSGDAAASVHEYTSSWPYFSMMLFLKEQMTPAQTVCNLENSNTELPGNSTDNTLDVSVEDTSFSVTPPSPSEPPTKKRKPNNDYNFFLLAIEENKLVILANALHDSPPPPPTPPPVEDCEDLSFLKSLPPQLKTLDPIKKLLVRNQINMVVVNAMQDS
ncbi:uncharacterized protein LOC142492211 [Ascaphus truei]|uniref:uncharacterized protein LOC142492211 n=1 Tax=Ascaphus truei TaxID=8439 RepID=UPI003F5A6EBA